MVLGLFRRKEPRFFEEPEAAAPSGSCLYAIGDVHGCLDQLRGLVEKIMRDAEERDVERKVLIYLGDYVDRGPQSKETLAFLMEGPPEGFEQVCLRGNHEEAFLKFLKEPGEQTAWLTFGGTATCASYGVDIAAAKLSGEIGLMEWMQGELDKSVPSAHRDFLAELPLSHEEGDYLFVHAGIRPGVPLAEQSEQDLLWIREDFLFSNDDHGKVVVHGHTPESDPVLRHNRIGLDTGACYGGQLTAAVLFEKNVCFLQV